MTHYLAYTVVLVYIFASVLYILEFLFHKNIKLGYIPGLFLIVGFGVHSTLLLYLFIQNKYVPFGNFSQALSFCAWIIIPIYLYIEARTREKLVGLIVIPFIALLQLCSFLIVPSQITPEHIFKSFWFEVHIFTALLSYAAFLIALVGGCLYLLLYREIQLKQFGFFYKRISSLEVVDQLGYRSIVVGLLCLTIAIATGDLWAYQEWGDSELMSVKQMLSYLTWLIYGFYLFSRRFRGWSGKRSAYLSIAGFCVVLFSFLAVSFFVQDKHTFL